MHMLVDVEAYLDRIGFTDIPKVDLATLTALQRAHLTSVPFENLDVVAGVAVRTDLEWSLHKIIDRRRGGWCFELNGAFSALLEALGFDVRLIGAAVLLDGPNQRIDHLTLEVTLDKPYLVDVGFGESFIVPLELNRSGTQDGGAGIYEFIGSSQGLTLTVHDSSDIPVPQYRFKRVDRTLGDFNAASERLRSDPELHWSVKPFATRLIEGGPDRITLLKDRLKLLRDGRETETAVRETEWADVLRSEFSMSAAT
jgi:N-hydroxyarylamine O-acetyltransferase